MTTVQLGFFDDDDEVRRAWARRTDPVTSYEAAESVQRIRATQARILQLLHQFGPMTDEQIADAWLLQHCPTVSGSGLRTRRKELVDAGHVLDTGERQRLHSGRRAIVWGAA